MIEAARQRRELTPDDVLRLSDAVDRGDADGDGDGGGNGAVGGPRIALPGMRKVIQPKTPGQAEYLQKIQDNDIVVGIGPAGTGKTYLAVAAAVDALTREARAPDRARAARPSKRARASAFCPATCRPRSIRIFVRSTTRSTR